VCYVPPPERLTMRCLPGRALPGVAGSVRSVVSVPIQLDCAWGNILRVKRLGCRKMAVRFRLAVLSIAVLGVLFLLVGAPDVANAHPGHDHAPPAAHASRQQVPIGVASVAAFEAGAVQRTAIVKAAGPEGAEVHLASHHPTAPQPSQADNCCCGSVACHVVVEASTAPIVWPRSLSQKFDLSPVQPMPENEWGGIERPPRSPIAL
jgi:hypothetical protein